MKERHQMTVSRHANSLAALLLFVFIFSCTANKKVVDDDFATDTASEDSVSSDDAVSEDDLFAENSMSDAGSDSNSESQSADAGTSEQAPQEQAAADEFSDFEEPAQPAEQDPAVAQNDQQQQPTENLDDLNLDEDPAATAEQPPMAPSEESLTDEQKAQAAVEPIPEPEVPPVAETPVITTPEPVPEASTEETASVSVPQGEMARIREVQFRGNENGGALLIKANRELQYTTRLNSTTNQLVVEVQNATVPKKLMRPLITKDMSSSIGTIDIYQRPNSSIARFVIQLRADSPEPLIQPEGDTLLVIGTPMFGQKPSMGSAEQNRAGNPQQQSPMVQPSSPDQAAANQPPPTPMMESPAPQVTQNPTNQNMGQLGNQLSQSVIPLQTTGAAVDLTAKGLEGSSTRANYDLYTKGLLSSRDLQDFLTNNNRYYGKKISIVTQDLEVRDVLNFLSEEASVNLIYDDDISGKVSIKLRRVPWDQALVTLLKSKKLGYQRQGSILRIAQLQTLLREEDEAVKIRDARLDQEPLVVRNFRINYADIGQLEGKIKEFIADAKKDATNRGRVSSDARTNTIIVTETPTKLKQVEELIQALDTQPQQVQIEARIIEASETFSKNIGVKWGLNNGGVNDTTIPSPFNRGKVATGLAGSDMSAMPSMSMSPSLGVAGGALNTNLWFGRIGAFGDLELNLNLGQIENKIKVLSSPRIVVLSGTSATVDQRVKVNVQDESTSVTTGTGGSTSQTKFKSVEAGVNLNVSPQISNIDTVRLKLNITKSVITDAVKGDISSRSATSEIILKSMQTAVIGGVFESQQNEQRSGVPGLQDMPVLGGLFRGKNELNTKSELMIFLTPKILPPLSLPTDSLSVMPNMYTPPTPPAMDQSMNTVVEPAPEVVPPPTDPAAETTEEELQLE